MPTYRLNGSSVVLNLSHETANSYNRVSNSMAAHWDSHQLLDNDGSDTRKLIVRVDGDITDADLETYGKVADLLNLMIELNDGGIPNDTPLDQAILFTLVD